MKRFSLISLPLLLCLVGPALAKSKPPEQFAPNPLESKAADPLLPTPDRPLTSSERDRLSQSLDALNLQAATQLTAGDSRSAFETWNRELRLRRALGSLSEVSALGRVGEVAWQQNNTPQVRWIIQRLDAIAAPLQPSPAASAKDVPVSPPLSPADSRTRSTLMNALGIAYQQVRSPKPAISLYQQLLTFAQQRRDAAAETATRLNLAQIYLTWFNYPQAAEMYAVLLKGATDQGAIPSQMLYLTQLIYIHEQAKQPAQAIPYQQQLIALYQQQPQTPPPQNPPNPIPKLSLKLGDNYARTGKLDQAEATYQATYKLAQVEQQLGNASEALQKLGDLYRRNDRIDAALRTYDFLVGVEFQSYNYYGMMAAYDQIGQIHRSRKAYGPATVAFQRGLELATRLQYREDYFSAQIQALSQLPLQP
jgi:tetratricopeptide (TPR) repeat protein